MSNQSRARTQAPTFFAIVDAIAHIANHIGDLEGHHNDAAPLLHLRLPISTWKTIEDEMADIGPDVFEEYCTGISVYADGVLKQMNVLGCAMVGCKTKDVKYYFDYRKNMTGGHA